MQKEQPQMLVLYDEKSLLKANPRIAKNLAICRQVPRSQENVLLGVESRMSKKGPGTKVLVPNVVGVPLTHRPSWK